MLIGYYTLVVGLVVALLGVYLDRRGFEPGLLLPSVDGHARGCRYDCFKTAVERVLARAVRNKENVFGL